MKWIIYTAFTFLVVIIFTAIFLPHDRITLMRKSSQSSENQMRISSPAFKHNERISSKYTCDGQNINPPLEFLDVPKEAKSLTLLVEDPDAPSTTFHHWSIYNMRPSVKGIQENSLPPSGIQGMTDFGSSGYGGPCPPSGSHHYHFKLYALDIMLDVPDKATFNELIVAMENHIVSQTEIIGLYSRVN